MAEEAGAGAGAGATTEVAGEWRHESGYILTNDPERVDLEALHRFLSTEAYWSVDITKERVALAVKHSVPFSLLSPTGEFVGFCRLNTDHVTFTYLSDVYVDKRHRKRGLSKWFLDHILATDYVTNVRSVFLMTKSAQKLYAKFGFEVVENRCMVYRPGVAKDVGRYDWRLVESAPLVPHAFEEVGHLHRHQLWVEVLANHRHAQVFVQRELVHA